jgi:hypothetical protein
MSLYRSGSAAILTVALLTACQSDPSSDSKSAEDETAPIPVEVGLPVRGDVYAMYSGTAPIAKFASCWLKKATRSAKDRSLRVSTVIACGWG